MRALPFLLLILVAGAVAGERTDHYDPLSLNEQAAAALRAGDRDLAAILLERAARLAPEDQRVAENLRALRGQPPLADSHTDHSGTPPP